MNVSLKINLEFPAGIYFQDTLRLNRYTVALELCTATQDHEQINVAMDRIKAFVYSELADTVFINQDDAERANIFEVMGVNVTTLPEDPIDQIVGLMLYCKLNAVIEGRMLVEALDISSFIGDEVTYLYNAGDPIGPFQQGGWWFNADTSHNELSGIGIDQNIVHVHTHNWSKYNLNWHNADQSKTSKTVAFGKRSDHAK
jgi:hypothetical protein